MQACPDSPATPAARYWRYTRRLTLLLLLLWLVVTFGTIFFACELDHVQLFGWPLSFYLGAQGLMLFYLTIVGLYTVCMGRAERRLHAEQTHGA